MAKKPFHQLLEVARQQHSNDGTFVIRRPLEVSGRPDDEFYVSSRATTGLRQILWTMYPHMAKKFLSRLVAERYAVELLKPGDPSFVLDICQYTDLGTRCRVDWVSHVGLDFVRLVNLE